MNRISGRYAGPVLTALSLLSLSCPPSFAQEQTSTLLAPNPASTQIPGQAAGQAAGQNPGQTPENGVPQPPPDPTKEPQQIYMTRLKMLPQPAIEKLLAGRLNGFLAPNQPFVDFMSEFFVRSKLDLNMSIGVASKSAQINAAVLEPAFPANYKPTLRELLDAIALQTNSKWSYEESAQVVPTEDQSETPLEGIAIFEFTPLEQPQPLGFAMTPASGWRVERHGNWEAYIPPTAPLALDFHVSGRITDDDPGKQAETQAKAPEKVCIDAYKKVKPIAAVRDLTKAKVGPYDAFYCEHSLPIKTGENIRWRQWNFIVGDQLMYVVSTIPKEKENELLPAILEMVKSFHKQ